jgi:hypothetical protein
MKDALKMIFNTEMVMKNYKMVPFMKVNFLKDRNMDMESTRIKMDQSIKDIGIKINLMETVNIYGLMVENIRGSGRVEKCMGKEFINGLMEKNMMEITMKIKSMAMEYISGLTVKNMKEIGILEASMEKENLLIRKESKNGVFGKMVRENNG